MDRVRLLIILVVLANWLYVNFSNLLSRSTVIIISGFTLFFIDILQFYTLSCRSIFRKWLYRQGFLDLLLGIFGFSYQSFTPQVKLCVRIIIFMYTLMLLIFHIYCSFQCLAICTQYQRAIILFIFSIAMFMMNIYLFIGHVSLQQLALSGLLHFVFFIKIYFYMEWTILQGQFFPSLGRKFGESKRYLYKGGMSKLPFVFILLICFVSYPPINFSRPLSCNTEYETLLTRPIQTCSRKNIMIVFFIDHSTYLNLLGQQPMYMYEAAKRSPCVSTVILFGPGWPGYNPFRSMTQNVKMKLSGKIPDIIYSFEHRESSFLHDPMATFDGLKDTIFVTEMSECYRTDNFEDENLRAYWTRRERKRKCISSNGCFNFFEEYNGKCGISRDNVLLSPIRHEMMPLADIAYRDDLLIGYSPFCVSQSAFTPTKPVVKINGAVLIGTIDPHGIIYPLRFRLARLIKDGWLNAHIFKHPGYLDIKSSGKKLTKERMKYGKIHQKRFINLLQKTKILLFDSSTFQYKVKKFSESFAAGSLVMSDLPVADMHRNDPYDRILVALSMEDSDREIVAKIHSMLIDDEKVCNISKMAQKYALEHLDCHKRFANMLSYVEQYRKGKRGISYTGRRG